MSSEHPLVITHHSGRRLTLLMITSVNAARCDVSADIDRRGLASEISWIGGRHSFFFPTHLSYSRHRHRHRHLLILSSLYHRRILSRPRDIAFVSSPTGISPRYQITDYGSERDHHHHLSPRTSLARRRITEYRPSPSKRNDQ